MLLGASFVIPHTGIWLQVLWGLAGTANEHGLVKLPH